MTLPIETQPEPEAVTRAGDLLEAILLSEPSTTVHLAVATALATLYDVYPPYPPPSADVTEAISPRDGLPLAKAALQEAIDTSTSVADILRFGLASRALHQLNDPT